jgi:ABC transporter with metal-binding/Fe-S-binding domain ATP-binding protein
VAALFSGGKDSTLAARLTEEDGHQVPILVTMRSGNPDSYMFHTVNVDAAGLQAEAWGKQWVQAWTAGEKEKELDDLKATLEGLPIEGVVSGAIASSYQRDRVERICDELGLTHLSPLWGRGREELLRLVLNKGMKIIFTAVAARGLDESWLGRRLNESALKDLLALSRDYGVDPCGEGGEYESMVLDAPWFSKEIVVSKADKTWDGVSGRYIIMEARLHGKRSGS